MPEDVRDGVLTHIGLSQSHSDRVPEIVHPQVDKVGTVLAGLAAPILLGGVAHRPDVTSAERKHVRWVLAPACLDNRLRDTV